ncbi:hypothetical protein CEXT_340141 [Caerostris extrusa]|uniref:Uncharacterized protein n=1 Tax=Caerostris extrusa TaxID=172846 RepID=A0AAV4P8R6_CAEEX|nr:hypothetical protein CEXT_340141 [Caerostris extrusa]
MVQKDQPYVANFPNINWSKYIRLPDSPPSTSGSVKGNQSSVFCAEDKSSEIFFIVYLYSSKFPIFLLFFWLLVGFFFQVLFFLPHHSELPAKPNSVWWFEEMDDNLSLRNLRSD